MVEEIRGRIIGLENHKKTMIEYLALKFYEQDYHGVQDAASDIRDIESAIKELSDILKLDGERRKKNAHARGGQ